MVALDALIAPPVACESKLPSAANTDDTDSRLMKATFRNAFCIVKLLFVYSVLQALGIIKMFYSLQ
jgi:hypothetical protein